MEGPLQPARTHHEGLHRLAERKKSATPLSRLFFPGSPQAEPVRQGRLRFEARRATPGRRQDVCAELAQSTEGRVELRGKGGKRIGRKGKKRRSAPSGGPSKMPESSRTDASRLLREVEGTDCGREEGKKKRRKVARKRLKTERKRRRRWRGGPRPQSSLRWQGGRRF